MSIFTKMFSSAWWPVPVLCVIIGFQLYYFSAPPEPFSKTGSAVSDNFQMPELRELNPDDYLSITRRPLFEKSRRSQLPVILKSTPEEANKTVTHNQPDHLQLTAIIITQNSRFAIMQDRQNRTRLKSFEGDRLGNWLLKEIKASEVVLTHDGKTHTIQLRDNKARQADNKKASNKVSRPPQVRRPRRQLK